MKGRTYRYTNDALFPFGYGLSYTKFEIGKAQVSKTEISKDETLNFTIPVKNAGKRSGTEIVQVYIRKIGDIDGPLKTLKAFQRVEIGAGKTANVAISLDPSAFEFYSWDERAMTVAPGEYEVLYGNNSVDKDLKSFVVSVK
jgi:beta-glucosidase